jgi:hypothetical protein
MAAEGGGKTGEGEAGRLKGREKGMTESISECLSPFRQQRSGVNWRKRLFY